LLRKVPSPDLFFQKICLIKLRYYDHLVEKYENLLTDEGHSRNTSLVVKYQRFFVLIHNSTVFSITIFFRLQHICSIVLYVNVSIFLLYKRNCPFQSITLWCQKTFLAISSFRGEFQMVTCIYSVLETTSINIGVKCFDYICYMLSSAEKRRWIQVFAKGLQFLFLIRHPPCYSYNQILFTCCRWWRK